MKKRLFVFCLISSLLCIFSLNANGIVKGKSKSYKIKVGVSVKNPGLKLTKLIFAFPLPQTNQYQKISNVKLNGGKVLNIPNSKDKYVRFIVEGNNLPGIGKTREYFFTYDAVLYDIKTDFSKKNIVKSSITPKQFLMYTSKDGNIIDTSNKVLLKISNELWKKSDKDKIGYAKLCYEYAAKNYKYKKANTGLHPLKTLLQWKGGDCGNLSTIFVTLMRMKKIPSRHLVTYRPDGSYHAWADFHTDEYGWIPVDVTYKNSNPKGDYFGKVDLDSNGIILNRKINVEIDYTYPKPYVFSVFQMYGWWFWHNGGSGQPAIKFYIEKL